VLAEDECVNVVGALIGLHGLQIHHVAHDGVVFRNSVCADGNSLEMLHISCVRYLRHWP
jgi:hypothetical protein